MSETDRTYLQRILDDNRAESRPEMEADKYFEIFSAEQVLKKYELNDGEIESGIVGKAGDGGIDSVYCFIDRLIVREDTSISHLKKANRPVRVELVVIQSKSGKGSFNAAVMEKLLPTVTDLFNISRPISEFAKHYNKKLIDIVDRFRKHLPGSGQAAACAFHNFSLRMSGRRIASGRSTPKRLTFGQGQRTIPSGQYRRSLHWR